MNKVEKHDAAVLESHQKITIEFLCLDLTVCTRCLGTDANLREALSEVAQILKMAGVEADVRKIQVESEAQARALGFFSSPTIRINGNDIALEFRESRCESCESCVSNGTVDCRVWIYQGREYTKAPKAMIVDAILREVYGGSVRRKSPSAPRGLPENLRRFFADRAGQTASESSSCCPPDEQVSCCESSEKAACCPSESTDCACH
jgi:Domain of unknown function (DUF2703)